MSKKTARTNKNWSKLQEFQAGNKDLFIIIADPKTDEMSISFQERFGFVRFPSKDMLDGVIFNALRQSKFSQAIDPFMTGFSHGTGISEKTKEGNEVMSAIGGSMRAIGMPSEHSKLEIIKNNKQTNGKGKK